MIRMISTGLYPYIETLIGDAIKDDNSNISLLSDCATTNWRD